MVVNDRGAHWGWYVNREFHSSGDAGLIEHVEWHCDDCRSDGAKLSPVTLLKAKRGMIRVRYYKL